MFRSSFKALLSKPINLPRLLKLFWIILHFNFFLQKIQENTGELFLAIFGVVISVILSKQNGIFFLITVRLKREKYLFKGAFSGHFFPFKMWFRVQCSTHNTKCYYVTWKSDAFFQKPFFIKIILIFVTKNYKSVNLRS